VAAGRSHVRWARRSAALLTAGLQFGTGRKLQAVEKPEKNVPPCDFVQCAIALT
jgi:hypothetical protein